MRRNITHIWTDFILFSAEFSRFNLHTKGTKKFCKPSCDFFKRCVPFSFFSLHIMMSSTPGTFVEWNVGWATTRCTLFNWDFSKTTDDKATRLKIFRIWNSNSKADAGIWSFVWGMELKETPIWDIYSRRSIVICSVPSSPRDSQSCSVCGHTFTSSKNRYFFYGSTSVFHSSRIEAII